MDHSLFGKEDERECEGDLPEVGSHWLGLSKGYLPLWGYEEALREFIQNWKDGMAESSGLDPRDIELVMTEYPDQIQITAHPKHASGTKEPPLLGFIRFDKTADSLEFTNFGAQLGMRHLHMGGTTKTGHDRYAGQHGEGLKIAALVMCRNEHPVQMGASSHRWSFNLSRPRKGPSILRCQISQAKRGLNPKKKETLRKLEAPMKQEAPMRLNSDISKDVTVMISMLSEARFRLLEDITIDIKGLQPEGVIETDRGDLILNKQFSGRIYLKGLRVRGHRSHDRGYRCCYNFVEGQINRDRQRMTDGLPEAKMVAKIWKHAIVKEGDIVTKKYIDLFYHHAECADIALSGSTVSRSTARAVWNQLRRDNQDTFFYSGTDDSRADKVDQLSIITTDLKKQPLRLPKDLWTLMRKFSLARSPKEEKTHQFAKSEMISVPDTGFANHISRALSASLSLHPRTKDIKITFVKGGTTDIDVLFDEEHEQLLVHERWLDFQETHVNAGCEVSRLIQKWPTDMAAFACDHVVEDLFELALNNFRGPLELDPLESVTLRQAVRERVRQTPRLIKVFGTPRSGEIKVSWIGNESAIITEEYGASIQYHVTLHKMSTCKTKMGRSIRHIGTDPAPVRVIQSSESALTRCGCQCQVASRDNTQALFSGLTHREKYFPMIARVGSDSFFGLPPLPIAPRQHSALERASPAKSCSASERATAPKQARASEREPTTSQALAKKRATKNNVTLPMRGENALIAGDIGDEYDSEFENTAVWLSTPHKDAGAESSHQNQHSQPDKGERKAPDKDAVDLLAWNQDYRTWQMWHEQDLTSIFRALVPERGGRCLETTSYTLPSLSSDRLNYVFEKNEYAHVRFRAEGPLEYIILIHDVRGSHGSSDEHSVLFKVTKYSFLKSSQLFRARRRSPPDKVATSDKELLLHFEDFNKMGKESDAETVRLDSIAYIRSLAWDFESSSESVDYVVLPPSDLTNCGLFCRFAISNSVDREDICITPIASGLLRRQDRQKPRKFGYPNKALVSDLTPNVLGPLEGFMQADCLSYAGLGFEPERHATWRIRHPSCPVYDGSHADVSKDILSGKLEPPPSMPHGCAKIALIAGENSQFRLSKKNRQMPSKEEALRPLVTMDAAPELPLEPDFLVMMTPPNLLHHSTIGRFSTSILKLLEQGFSVHMRLSPLQDHGIPQSRSTLIVIASRSCVPLPWDIEWPDVSRDPPVKIRDLIGDLVPKNSRVTQDGEGGFVSTLSVQKSSASPPAENMKTKNIYNHQTGRTAPFGEAPVDMDAEAISVSCNSPKALIHPTRGDLLTVREIARLQNFEDECVFYGLVESQYRDVLNAQPPIVAKTVAKTILHAIKSSRVVRVGEVAEGVRAKKRARVEDAAEGARASKRVMEEADLEEV